MASVLVVDDDQDIRETVQEVLIDEGYEVTLAENGKIALDLLRAGLRPNCLLLDLSMPVMDGATLAREMAGDEALRAIPVIISTAKGNHDPVDEVPTAAAFVRKPIALKSLLEAIAKF